jgi:hypothetical protein
MFRPPWRKSKLGTLWTCRWLAYAIYGLGLQYKPTAAAALGIATHAVIAYELAKSLGWEHADRYLNSYKIQITEEAYELAEQGIENLPIDPTDITGLEVGLAIDKKGQRSPAPQHDWLTGILDVIAEDDDTLYIVDHKTGRWQTDNVFERHDYVALAHAHYPKFKKISFGRYWVRTGDCDWFHYRWERKGRGPQKLFIDDEEHDSRYLFTYIKEKIDYAESLEPLPDPGEHCENLYGEPCPFLGNECPLAENGAIVPDPGQAFSLPKREDVQFVLETMPPEKRMATAFRMVLQGLPDDQITPEIADLAKQGIAHVRNGATKVNARLKELAQHMCFQSGGRWHGMKPKRTVDVEAALSIMFGRDISIKDMAKAVSISKTGIQSLPASHSDTMDYLLDNCVDEAGGEDFGPICKVTK